MVLSLIPVLLMGSEQQAGELEKCGILVSILTVNKEFNPQTTSWNEEKRKQVSGSGAQSFKPIRNMY